MVYVAAAVLPAMLILIWLYHRNSVHPLSKRTIYGLYLLGGGIVLPAGLLERGLLQTSVGTKNAGFTLTLITAFFVAGMVEEFLKAAIVDRRAVQKGILRTPMDVMMACGAVALGFATIENILYVTSSGFSTAILRSVTAIPAHTMFGIVMGSAYTRHLFYGANRAWAYILPALAHGLYDAFALSGSILSDVLLVTYLLVLLEYALRKLDWAARLNLRRPTTATT